MRFYSKTLLVAVGGLALAACKETPRLGEDRPAVQVTVATAAYETVPSLIVAPGSVQPRNRVSIAAQINGFVRSVAARAGDTVQAGQEIATLDARDAESQKAASLAGVNEAKAALQEARNGEKAAASMLEAARANSRLAASTFDRFQKLYEAKSVSPQELDEARAKRDAAAADLAARETMVAAARDRLQQVEARIAQATAQAQRADVLLSWTTITAPESGRIVERAVDPGTAIFPGSPLFVIETLGRPQVLADLPTAQSAALRPGMQVAVHMPSQGTPVQGRISEIIPLSNPQAHTVQFKVDLPAGAAAISGQYARVEIPSGDRQALLVPKKALRETGQLTGLYVATPSGRAQMRIVKPAAFDSERVEILAGLERGERYVTSLTDAVTDGSPLEIRP